MSSGSRNPGQPGPVELRPGPHDHIPPPGEEWGKVLPFKPRTERKPTGAPPPDGPGLPTRPAATPPAPAAIADLRRYARADEPDDFRHRMKTNAAALLLVLLLMGGGYWIASTLADMRKSQDCVLSGRRGCSTVTVSPAGP